jgi:glycosyltransferase involved in cell wall biosynthesis
MRLGLVIYGALETVSGGYLYDRRLVEHLRRAGDTVEVLSMPWGPYGRCLAHNLEGHYLDRMAQPFDILLQDELNHPSLAWLNGRLGRRPPVISIVHHLRCSEARPAWQNRAYASVERRYLRSVDGFIFNSQTTRAAVEALAGAGRPSVVAHPAGDRLGAPLDAGTVARRAREGPLRVLFVGNLIPRKGLNVLLEALAGVDEPWELAVVGSETADPAHAARLRSQAGRLGLNPRVRFAGNLPDDALREEMARAHLLAVPSSYEGFGIVYLEGMAFGLPAVATTAGAAPEIITDGTDGFLVPAGDAAPVSRRLALLARDRERLAAMGTAALARFGRHPTWEQTGAAVRAFLLERIA